MFRSSSQTKQQVEYTEKFKNEVIKHINNGLSYTEISKIMGVDWFSSSFRDLYYRLERNEKHGKYLPPLNVKTFSKSNVKVGKSSKPKKKVNSVNKKKVAKSSNNESN